ncbi:hypothetical protein [Chlorobium sp. KB01]|uniref:hypothetical protein n=1 Tax=Chlorobium sp. KB01 TaxID=1917528 RepID=UPI0009762C2B|nr:hypothetical protein [Chlorobium sp. KB01]
MITDTELKIKGVDSLIRSLGEVDAERFIALVMREPFDYTKWRRTLWIDKSIEELSAQAMKEEKKGQG